MVVSWRRLLNFHITKSVAACWHWRPSTRSAATGSGRCWGKAPWQWHSILWPGWRSLRRRPWGGATIDAVVEDYVSEGWRCDRAALEAMATVNGPTETSLVARVVRAIYEPWLDKSARHFQSMAGYEGTSLLRLTQGVSAEKDVCMLFRRWAAIRFGSDPPGATGVARAADSHGTPNRTIAHSDCHCEAVCLTGPPVVRRGGSRREVPAHDRRRAAGSYGTTPARGIGLARSHRAFF